MSEKYNLDKIKNRIICGDALTELKKFPDESIDVIITSPPYFGLRRYGEQTEKIWGGNKECAHYWTQAKRYLHRGSSENNIHAGHNKEGGYFTNWITNDNFCQKCGAWKGELGLEPTFEMFQEHLLEIFKEIKRVLKKSGSFWLNIGDIYCSQPAGNTYISKANQGKQVIFQCFFKIKLLNKRNIAKF